MGMGEVNGQYWWDILISQQMYVCYYRVVCNNFVCQQDSAPVHLAFNTVQMLQKSSQLPFFLSYGP